MCRVFWWFLGIGMAAASGFMGHSNAAEVPKISAYAPVEDLLQQVDFFVGRVSESLADPQDFDEAKQSRTVKDANTLAALGLVLAYHDQDFPQKATMGALVAAAQALASVKADHAQGAEALAAIKLARTGSGPQMPAPWQKTASLSVLMKAVPLVHNGLKRGVDGSRLARQAAQSAGQAATLAAIAQASWLDDELAKNPEELQAWRGYCAEMRDAAGEVNAAVHAQNATDVAKGMARLSRSCDACHVKFKDH